MENDENTVYIKTKMSTYIINSEVHVALLLQCIYVDLL